jgi:hypothetical protein
MGLDMAFGDHHADSLPKVSKNSSLSFNACHSKIPPAR